MRVLTRSIGTDLPDVCSQQELVPLHIHQPLIHKQGDAAPRRPVRWVSEHPRVKEVKPQTKLHKR